ncbi:MAG TPA: hypothetical protein VEU11_11750 [Terriglobales bacterium]|nr:hypothetical protein [Terriglobales bacterium]
MLLSQEVSVFLNNTLKATHRLAELDLETPLPSGIREMPEQVSGRFIGLDSSATQEMNAAWKRIMILNPTGVLYTFTFDPQTATFMARKR